RLKLEQQALRESEQRYRETFECAAVAIAHVSLEGQWLQVNQTMCEITGYSHDELLSLRFQDITHLDDLPADLEQLQRLLDSEKNTYSMQKRYIRKDGQPTWVQLTVSLVRRPPVEPDYFVAVVERIDDRKLAEQSLRESDER